jgi:hypothetical protein
MVLWLKVPPVRSADWSVNPRRRRMRLPGTVSTKAQVALRGGLDGRHPGSPHHRR